MINHISCPWVLNVWYLLIYTRVFCSPLNIDQYNPLNTDDFMEGDIRINKRRLADSDNSPFFAQRRYQALSEPSAKWPNAEVPFTYEEQEFGPGFQHQLTAAIQEFDSRTCVRFRPKTSLDSFHLVLRNADGCWSYVGRRLDMSTGQETSLDPRCWQKGIIVHELMHVLGFFHEHSRYDRDTFVIINKSNIEPTRFRQFEKREADEVDLLGRYDFESIMHYERNAFAINRLKPTIIPRSDNVVAMGQRIRLSDEDVLKINKLYCPHLTTNVGQTLLQPSTPDTKLVPSPLLPVPFNPVLPGGWGVNGGFGFQGGVDGRPPTTTTTQGVSYPTCIQPSQAQCDDSRMDCADLARMGMCERKPGMMLTQCRRTCCNCDYSRCFDTTDQNKFNTLCTPTFSVGLLSRSACDNPSTALNAQDYCPKTCKIC